MLLSDPCSTTFYAREVHAESAIRAGGTIGAGGVARRDEDGQTRDQHVVLAVRRWGLGLFAHDRWCARLFGFRPAIGIRVYDVAM